MSRDGSSVVYSSPRSGHGDIYNFVREGKRAGTVRLTLDPNYEGDPQLSADGGKIVFVREQSGVGHIWIMKSDGADQRQLTAGAENDSGPSFSPEGNKILFSRRVRSWKFVPGTAASSELYVMNADGSEQTRLTNNEVVDWEASFSPDGRRILYSVWSRELYVADTRVSKPTRLGVGSAPAFSPDGKRIVFMSGEFGRSISIMNDDGTDVKKVYHSQTYKSHPSFCLGGSHILFLDEPESRGTGNIRMLKLSDGTVTTITSTE
jgi:Tol biopolymer transport system component